MKGKSKKFADKKEKSPEFLKFSGVYRKNACVFLFYMVLYRGLIQRTCIESDEVALKFLCGGSMKFKSNEEIRQAIQGVADEMDIEIIEVAAKISKNPSLTVFIDTENGVDLDICEKFHNAIDPVLDELDPSFGAAYTLNVSSPGLDRPLKTERDFKKCIGKEVEIKLATPIKGEKYLESTLVGYDGNNVLLNDGKDGDKDYKIPLTKIEKINQAIKFD